MYMNCSGKAKFKKIRVNSFVRRAVKQSYVRQLSTPPGIQFYSDPRIAM